MRYRRLSYRYTAVTRQIATWPLGMGRGELLAWSFGQPQWRPDVDMCESAASIDVVVDLAGVEEDAVEVQLFEDALVVEGRRQLSHCPEGARFHVAGIRQGPFRLELPLPQAFDAADVEARYEQGLLRITLRKQARGR